MVEGPAGGLLIPFCPCVRTTEMQLCCPDSPLGALPPHFPLKDTGLRVGFFSSCFPSSFLLLPSGTITWENLAAVLPFGGTFDLVQLKGSTLKKAFEHSVYRYGQSTGEFLQVGGKSPPKGRWGRAGWSSALLTEPSWPGLFGFSHTHHRCIVFQWPWTPRPLVRVKDPRSLKAAAFAKSDLDTR